MTVPASSVAFVNSGKLSSPLGPVSMSPGSLRVTPLTDRSMPSPPLEWIELPSTTADRPRMLRKAMPSSPLKAIVLAAPAAIPPMSDPPVPDPVSIPSSPLGSGAAPKASVPIRLPCTTPLSRSSRIPSTVLPDTRLPSFGPVPPMVASSASMKTPSAPLAMESAPAASVPM